MIWPIRRSIPRANSRTPARKSCVYGLKTWVSTERGRSQVVSDGGHEASNCDDEANEKKGRDAMRMRWGRDVRLGAFCLLGQADTSRLDR